MNSLTSAWDVFVLFLIPVGGGIPGGVLLAKSRHLAWPLTALLYLISDVVLACVFEPLMLGVIAVGQKSRRLSRVIEALRENTRRSAARYGTKLSPRALILISFGVDPMTGRSAAKAAGHGFVSGWLLAIAGDMIYFAVLMVPTLWLNSILGDGTWATILILVVMMVGPMLFKKRVSV